MVWVWARVERDSVSTELSATRRRHHEDEEVVAETLRWHQVQRSQEHMALANGIESATRIHPEGTGLLELPRSPVSMDWIGRVDDMGQF